MCGRSQLAMQLREHLAGLVCEPSVGCDRARQAGVGIRQWPSGADVVHVCRERVAVRARLSHPHLEDRLLGCQVLAVQLVDQVEILRRRRDVGTVAIGTEVTLEERHIAVEPMAPQHRTGFVCQGRRRDPRCSRTGREAQAGHLRVVLNEHRGDPAGAVDHVGAGPHVVADVIDCGS